MNAVREGMATMVPVPVLLLMPVVVVERLVCGAPSVPIDALKRVARYRLELIILFCINIVCILARFLCNTVLFYHRDFEASSQVVRWLWEILEAMTEEDRVQFLIFVSGRSRDVYSSTNAIAFVHEFLEIQRDPPKSAQSKL